VLKIADGGIPISGKKPTVPVSERPVIQRVSRKLGRNDEVLRAARGAKAEQETRPLLRRRPAPEFSD